MQVLFQSSVKFVPVPLAKASHMTEPKVRVGGAYKMMGKRYSYRKVLTGATNKINLSLLSMVTRL